MKAIAFCIYLIALGIIGSVVSGDGVPLIFCVPIGIYLFPKAIKYGNRIFDNDFWK